MKNKKILSNKMIILLILIGLFILNTILVVSGNTEGFDVAVHDMFMNFESAGMTKFMNFITFFGSTLWIVIFSIIVVVLLFFGQKFSWSISTAVLIITSTLLNNGVKFLVNRPRPPFMMDIVNETTSSYPSGHTMAAVTLYGFILYLIGKSRYTSKHKIISSIFLSVLILLVCASRIYLGAHYFSDVFGGILLSSILILVFDLLNNKKHFIK